MPRAKSLIERSEVFASLKVHSLNVGEKKDCSVVAVSVVCGVSYDIVHATLSKLGRKDGHGVSTYAICEACRQLGFKVTRVAQQEFIQRYPSSHQILKSVTTHHPERFKAAFANEVPLLMFVNRHVSAFREGKLHDWAVGRALRCESIYRVTKI